MALLCLMLAKTEKEWNEKKKQKNSAEEKKKSFITTAKEICKVKTLYNNRKRRRTVNTLSCVFILFVSLYYNVMYVRYD